MPTSRRPGTLGTVIVSLGLVAASVVAGCSDDTGKDAAARAAPAPTSTPPAPSASSTPAPTTVPATGADLSKGPPYDRKAGPSGSGCTPPDGADLPAGWWAGRISNVTGNSFDFDVVCWFVGQAAIKAGGEDDAGPVEDDYYVRNSDPKRYRETFALASTPATCVGDDNRPFTCTVGDVLALYATAQVSGTVGGRQVTAFPTVWLHVTDREPDFLYMQFTP